MSRNLLKLRICHQHYVIFRGLLKTFCLQMFLDHLLKSNCFVLQYQKQNLFNLFLVGYLMCIRLKAWIGIGCKTTMPTLKDEMKKKQLSCLDQKLPTIFHFKNSWSKVLSQKELFLKSDLDSLQSWYNIFQILFT